MGLQPPAHTKKHLSQITRHALLIPRANPTKTIQCPNRCWFDVGPASQTLAQHETNIGLLYRAAWDA